MVVLLVLLAGIAGTVGGALVAGAAMTPRLVGAAETPSPSPLPAPTPTPRATLAAGVAAGFLQVAAVNDRLAGAAADLRKVLAARRPSAADVAPLLRKIAADARSGLEGSARIGAWPAAGALPADIAALYGAAAAVASDGLGAPLSNNSAYTTYGRRMLRALATLPAVTAATRDAAAARRGHPAGRGPDAPGLGRAGRLTNRRSLPAVGLHALPDAITHLGMSPATRSGRRR